MVMLKKSFFSIKICKFDQTTKSKVKYFFALTGFSGTQNFFKKIINAQLLEHSPHQKHGSTNIHKPMSTRNICSVIVQWML